MTDDTQRPDGDRALAAVAYIFHVLTGIIILLIAKREDRYVRWHAIQAIGFGIVAIVVGAVLNTILLPALGIGAGPPGVFIIIGWTGTTGAWNLLVLILAIVLAVKAAQGEKVRLPFIADYADKYA